MTDTIYPPDWHFAQRTTVHEVAVGDLLPVSFNPPPAEYHVDCQNCNDFRYVYARRVDRGGPLFWIGERRFHGHLQSAPCPVCRGDYLSEYLLERSGLAEIEVDGKPAQDIRLAGEVPLRGQEEAFQIANSLLAEIPSPSTWALFCSDYGRGKTHLLMGLVNGARVTGVYAHYTTSERILESLRRTYRNESVESTSEVRRRFERVPVLAVDELDRINWTDWAGEQLFAILNQRYLHERATYFASNLGPKALAERSEPLAALVSRITTGHLTVLTGPDLRPAMQPALLEGASDD